MQKLIVFNSTSVDGYFVDAKGDMGFAHSPNERVPIAELEAAARIYVDLLRVLLRDGVVAPSGRRG